jgi:hypothetical protein
VMRSAGWRWLGQLVQADLDVHPMRSSTKVAESGNSAVLCLGYSGAEKMTRHADTFGGPFGWVGAGSGLTAEVTRTSALAAYLERFVAFPTGFYFDFALYLRDPAGSGITDPHGLLAAAVDPKNPDRLRIRVDFGREARGGDAVSEAGPSGQGQHHPSIVRGHAWGRELRHTFWLGSLPPSRSVAFVCSWNALGLLQINAQVDGKELKASAARSFPIWPDL